jgi:hypothetical protein
VLQLPSELTFLGMDQKAPVQGLDGVPLPSGDVERPGEVQIQKARPPAVSRDRFLAENDALVPLPIEGEKKPAIREVRGVAASALDEPRQRLFGGSKRAPAIIAHRLLEENLALDRVHDHLIFGDEIRLRGEVP